MRVITDSTSSESSYTAFSREALARKVIEIGEDQLAASLGAFLRSLDKTLAQIPPTCGPYRVSELTVSVEITASGGIELIGNLNASASGGLTFTLVQNSFEETK